MHVIASYCVNCMLQLLCELAYLKKLTWSGPGFLNPPGKGRGTRKLTIKKENHSII